MPKQHALPMKPALTKAGLQLMYVANGLSAKDIATRHQCSAQKVNYWLAKYKIQKRSISEAVYIKRNPDGDPFLFKRPTSAEKMFLFGLGLGIYWGEGNKKNLTAIRLGNTDPDLIRVFIRFLKELYSIDDKKFKFGLQIFSDMNPKSALAFWVEVLKVSPSQFGKVIITPSRGIGTYKQKIKHGVLTVYVSNTRLRDLICREIENLRVIG